MLTPSLQRQKAGSVQSFPAINSCIPIDENPYRYGNKQESRCTTVAGFLFIAV